MGLILRYVLVSIGSACAIIGLAWATAAVYGFAREYYSSVIRHHLRWWEPLDEDALVEVIRGLVPGAMMACGLALATRQWRWSYTPLIFAVAESAIVIVAILRLPDCIEFLIFKSIDSVMYLFYSVARLAASLLPAQEAEEDVVRRATSPRRLQRIAIRSDRTDAVERLHALCAWDALAELANAKGTYCRVTKLAETLLLCRDVGLSSFRFCPECQGTGEIDYYGEESGGLEVFGEHGGETGFSTPITRDWTTVRCGACRGVGGLVQPWIDATRFHQIMNEARVKAVREGRLPSGLSWARVRRPM